MAGPHPLVAGEIIDLLARAELKGLKEDVHNVTVKIDSLASKGDIAALTHSIGIITQKQDRASTPQYGLILSIVGLGVTLMTIIGGAFAWSMNRDTARLDTAVVAILDRGVFQKQYDADQARETETLKKLREDLNITIQQQRYNTDQAKLTDTINDLRGRVEQLRTRSYDDHGRSSKLETEIKSQEKILDLLVARVNALRERMSK